MQIASRPLAPRETDYELLWLSVSLGGLALAAAWLALRLPWPICLFHALTGYPCATCGATRSGVAFFHGEFLTAWRWNPFAFSAYCSIAAIDVYAFVVLVMRAPRLRPIFSAAEKNILRGLFVFALLLNWAYLLVHARMFNS